MSQPAYRVLVAEDNHVMSDVLRFNLERAGFEVVVTNNGRLAVEQLRQAKFDLLITDYQMPEVDGKELCRTVREVLGQSEMPIVMCSAKGLELDTAELNARYGITKVIYKPFSMREIVALVRSLLTPTPATC
jgi:DNA-binding response OmpR family regulator